VPVMRIHTCVHTHIRVLLVNWYRNPRFGHLEVCLTHALSLLPHSPSPSFRFPTAQFPRSRSGQVHAVLVLVTSVSRLNSKTRFLETTAGVTVLSQ
jgi:hypothetical protein